MTSSESNASPATDEAFMRRALDEAAQGDFPFGAVIVRDGEIVARGRNAGKKLNDPTAHAEMMAIRDFVSRRPGAELAGATIYATGEPCPMCMGALLWCGVTRVVYAASIPRIAAYLNQIAIPCRTLAEAAPFVEVDILGDVLAVEALALFDEKSPLAAETPADPAHCGPKT